MRLDSKKLLFDVQRSAKLIQGFSSNKSRADFDADPMFRSASERQFEIIGEAIGRLAKTDPDTVQRIADYRKIISFRNVLIHGYDVVTNQITWEIIQTELPALLIEVTALLAEPDTPDATP